MTGPHENPLPTRGEINVHDSLDERCACDHFLGKDLPQAEAMFRDHFMTHQEDLMFMGPIAFRYYAPAAMSYLRSDDASDDSDAASSFANLVVQKLEWQQDDLRPIAAEMAAFCRYASDNIGRFACDPSIHGDVGATYAALHLSLKKLAENTSR